MQHLCQQTVECCRQVGLFLAQEFASFDRSRTEYKGRNDLVSYVDKQAEAQLVAALSALMPHAGFIAEEGSGEAAPDGLNWIVDPLDGTTNFIHGIPLFCISVALARGKELLLGVVHDPCANQTFYAWQGGGAYLDGRRLQVSAQPDLAHSLVATGFPYADFGKQAAYMALLSDVMERCHGLRRLGSAALDLAYTAAGRFEGFFEYNLNPWDVAAGTLLVQEAGGIVTDFGGGDDSTFGRELLAASPQVHPELLSLVRTAWH